MAAATLAVQASASAMSNAEIVGKLNAQRTANGMPAISESTTWSSRCLAHTHYEALNHYLGHDEDPSKPGYSQDGALGGKWGDQSEGSDWADGNPWENAPWHLHFLLTPWATQYGFAQSEGYNCASAGMGDLPFAADPASDQFFFYGYSPQGGTVPSKQTAFEAPKVPSEWAGIPAGTATGPNLMVWAWTPQQNGDQPDPNKPPLFHLDAATLTGPAGPVDVRVLNDSNDSDIGEPFGFVIPVQPLTPGATYTLTSTFSSYYHDRTATFTKTFTTDDRWLYEIKNQHGPNASPTSSLPSVTVKKTYSWRKIGKSGLPVTITSPTATKLQIVAVARHTLAVRRPLTKKVSADSTNTVRLKLDPAAMAFLLKKGHGRVTLTIVAGAGIAKTTIVR